MNHTGVIDPNEGQATQFPSALPILTRADDMLRLDDLGSGPIQGRCLLSGNVEAYPCGAKRTR